MTLFTATMTLILVMDPLGNIPIFLSVLNSVEPSKRTRIILREALIAFFILSAFLFVGDFILDSFNITEPAFRMSGGIILFLIALQMIFPPNESQKQHHSGEPFIVPLAIPLLAGPSALATVILFSNNDPDRMGTWFLALLIASALSTLILSFSNTLHRLLGEKALTAIERLMGLLLTTLAVQMFLTGLNGFLQSSPIQTI